MRPRKSARNNLESREIMIDRGASQLTVKCMDLIEGLNPAPDVHLELVNGARVTAAGERNF